MPEFPTHFIRPAPVRQPKLPVPPASEDSWKAAAVAALAMMTPAGQRRALAVWKKIGFTPPLPTP